MSRSALQRPGGTSRAAALIAASLSLPLMITPLVLPAGVASATSDSTGSVIGLALGERGPAVVELQQALIDAGVPVSGGADGHFGQATKTALRHFQDSNGLPATGEVDRETAVALGLVAERATGLSARPLSEVFPAELVGLSLGIVGPRVAELQRGLIEAGIPSVGGTDGVFGTMTKTALIAYQTGIGVEPTGRVDTETATALVRGTRPHLDLPTRSPDAPAASPESSDAPETPSTPDVAPDAPGGRLIGLAIGARGPLVIEVQQAMLDTGMRFPGGADGIFGIITEAALGEFQQRRGLPVTGRVDAATASALVSPGTTSGAAPIARPDLATIVGLAPGAFGDEVRALQQALLDTGLRFRGGADGIFGPVTAQALKQYQRSRGLEATGRLDSATADALSTNAPATVDPEPDTSTPSNNEGTTGHPSFGERGDRVRAMQQALIDAGVAVPGGADGIFGAQTAGAIMNFQRAEGLGVTGVIDDTTATRLGLTAAAAPAPPSTEGIRLQQFPVQGTCHFGDTWHAPRGGGRLHEGVDIIAPTGRYIYAVVDGTITHVYNDRPGSLTGNGLRLTMADGTYFFYAHLHEVAEGIGVGSTVRAGQIIGTNGSTGNAGIPHLHFEVHPRGGAAVNPYPFVRAVDGCSVSDPPPQP